MIDFIVEFLRNNYQSIFVSLISALLMALFFWVKNKIQNRPKKYKCDYTFKRYSNGISYLGSVDFPFNNKGEIDIVILKRFLLDHWHEDIQLESNRKTKNKYGDYFGETYWVKIRFDNSPKSEVDFKIEEIKNWIQENEDNYHVDIEAGSMKRIEELNKNIKIPLFNYI